MQVNVFPAFNNTYVARVYLKTEEAGKGFIVDYTSKREFLIPYYKDGNNVRFNINVDDKTMKKIKNMQRKVGQIISEIKNDGDMQKKLRRPGNQAPLNYMPNQMMIPGGMGAMGNNMAPMPPQYVNRMGTGYMPGPNQQPQAGMPSNMPQGMSGMPTGMPSGMPPGMGRGNIPPPVMGQPRTQQISDIRTKISKIVQ